MDCPFCNPITRQNAFAEHPRAIALYNITPVFPGHSLIIPKVHSESVLDLPAEDYRQFMDFARDVTRFLTRIYQTPHFDWAIQEGTAAGQSISHVHLHILPRKPNTSGSEAEWYEKLQENQVLQIDDPSRVIMDEKEYLRTCRYLREKWDQFSAHGK